MLDKKDVIFLDMNVDDALKWVISLGVVQPNALPNSPRFQKC